MKASLPVRAVLFAGAFAASSAFAAEFGTPKEAHAMLVRAVAELHKDKAAALEKFNKGEDGFKDRDLYTFCADLDGTTTAHPTHKGQNMNELKDKEGKAFGVEILKVATPGEFKQVSYMWPKPGQTEPVKKMTYVTRIGDQVCGVGYYKP